MERDEVLTPRDVAALLRLNLDTVRRLLREGRLPGRKVGPRQWRVLRSDLEAYLSRTPGRGESR